MLTLYIHRTNLDQEPVMGKIITTDAKTGNLLIAILAVVSAMGKALNYYLVTN